LNKEKENPMKLKKVLNFLFFSSISLKKDIKVKKNSSFVYPYFSPIEQGILLYTIACKQIS